jgi:PhzF family phenazine biosynthesis protein
MSLKIYQVDAFADRPFSGNPAAVCLLPEAAEESWLQAVASEMNLSETAFLLKQQDGYNLRWFTPKVEVDLCGHATLASAHVLWETGLLEKSQPARFHSRSGLLTAQKQGDLIEMNFPATLPSPADAPENLLSALSATPKYIGKSRFDYLLELASEAAVRELKPDFAALRMLPVRGIIVTSAATDANYDFVSRFFAPGAGIDEDPVTGSAHCTLAPFWSAKLGKTEMRAYQASARGGKLRVRVDGDRVYLCGHAVTVLAGELKV